MADLIRIEVLRKRVGDLLCCAFEGGSNYWYMIERVFDPEVITHRVIEGEYFRHCDAPINDGGWIEVSDGKQWPKESMELTTKRIDWPRCLEALGIMALKYPRHFGHWLSEDDDAETGDVFLQCCVFGETIYG